jgi:ATP-dependent RNA helicase DOB1
LSFSASNESRFCILLFAYKWCMFLLQMAVDVEEYVNSFRPDIMELVYAWCKGAKFVDVMKLAQVFEGSLIRALRRLEEVLQQLILAARAIGELDLEAKFQEASVRIRRDIVFAASLYL